MLLQQMACYLEGVEGSSGCHLGQQNQKRVLGSLEARERLERDLDHGVSLPVGRRWQNSAGLEGELRHVL